MVDPNRKINRLTEKDIEFLEECEQEFRMRYTEDDTEYMKHFTEPLSDPPIVENWNSNGGDYSRKESGNRYHNRNQRNWRNNYRNRRAEPHSNKHNRNSKAADYSKNSHQNIRRDYSNFVAASKDF